MRNEPISRSPEPTTPFRRRRTGVRPKQLTATVPMHLAPADAAADSAAPAVVSRPAGQRFPEDARHTASRAPRRVPLLVLADLGALATGAVVAHERGWANIVELGTVTALLVISAVLPGWQRPRFTVSASEELPHWLAAMSGSLLPLSVGTVVTGNVGLLRSALLAMTCIVVARTVAFAGSRAARLRGHLDALIVVGTGPTATDIFTTLQRHPEYGVQPCGFVGPAPTGSSPLPGPLLAPLAEVPAVLASGHIRRIVVDPDGMAPQDLDLLLSTAATSGAEVHIAARSAEACTATRSGPDHARCHPLLWVPRRWSRPEQLLWKRFTDLAVSVLALLVLAPSLLIIAVAVRLSSGGPVLFRQERLGQHGRPISVLKFRSMRVNDDSDVTWSVRADDRVTPVGRFLRATSLDELPQLLCIAKGEMSLVGARPERPFFVRRFERVHARYPARHRLRVGLTGLSQVHDLRGDTSIAERTRFDNFYIDHWSVWSDAVVLVRTLSAVVRYGRSAE